MSFQTNVDVVFYVKKDTQGMLRLFTQTHPSMKKTRVCVAQAQVKAGPQQIKPKDEGRRTGVFNLTANRVTV